MNINRRIIVIALLIVIGGLMASLATNYLAGENYTEHHVTSGKVTSNPDSTVSVSKSTKKEEIFNYILPNSSVFCEFDEDAGGFLVAVPGYTQDFELIIGDAEAHSYLIYVPQFDLTFPLESLGNAWMQHGQYTTLVEAFPLLPYAVRDPEFRSLILNHKFSVNGLLSKLHKDGSVTLDGFVLQVDGINYKMMLDTRFNTVKFIQEFVYETG
jgi:hypothetical protein